MRSALLVIFSALVLTGIFLGYWMAQPTMKVAVRPTINGPVEPPPPAVPNSNIRASSEGWVHQYDSNNKLTSEFRGDHFEPRANGTIDVTNPNARFFLSGGQYLDITGDTANIVMKQTADAGKGGGLMNSGTMSPPSRGRLEHVILKLIDQATNQVILTMRTRNVVFDNETFLISTDGFRDENGVDIAADQVPVHIVGQESGPGHSPYLKQMEGRGLNARWNDRDGRLELLEILHGNFLVIGNASSPTLPGSAPKSATPQVTVLAHPLSAMLASADPQAAGQAIPPATSRAAAPKPIVRSGRSTVVYRASFFDNVWIQQPDPSGTFDVVRIDNMNRMDVDFLLGSGGSATTRPATATAPATTTAPAPPATAQPNTAPPTVDPGTDAKPAEPLAQTTTTASTATTVPATQPAVPTEVIVHWTGRMFMAPLMTKPWSPLRPGDGAVKLIGQPMHMHRIDPGGGGFEDVRAATALYATSGDHLQLDRSSQFSTIFIDRIPPKTAKDQRQTHVVSTGQVQYARDAHDGQIARCVGPGFADVPMESDANAPPATMHAKWTRLAEFTMAPPPAGGQMALREGHFAGNVDIQDPRMLLRSELFDLYFGQITKARKDAKDTKDGKDTKDTPQQTLKQAVATTNVFCQFIGSDGKKQSIESNRLTLDMSVADEKSYPSHVLATGSVHAYTDDELRADNLDAVLKPRKPTTQPAATTQPAPTTRKSDDSPQVELQQMIAWDNVVAKSKDGSIATGDKLTVTADGGKQHTVLASATGAKVIDAKGNFLVGPEIEFDSADGKAYVIGAGHMEVLQASGSTTRPAAQKINVAWTTGAQFDGAANRIDADGNVKADTIDSRGFHDVALGDHALIHLQHKSDDDAATTQPAPQLASAAQPPAAAAALAAPTTVPAPAADSGQMNFFKDKEVVSITLDRHATLNSTQLGSNGAVEQQMILEGPRVIMGMINPDGSKSKSLSVPTAGRMLVRDHREPGASKKSESGDLHGAILFNWKRSLVYSEATGRADMKGDVEIQYNPSQGDPLPAKINGDHVIAYFEKSPAPAPDPKAPKPTKTDDDSGRMHLSKITILAGDQANVTVLHGDDRMSARQVDFDPAKHMLTGKGTQQNPVVFFNGSTGKSEILQVDWDTLTWNPHMQGAILDYHPHADTSNPKPKAKQ